MRRAILRSFAVAAITLAIGGATEIFADAALCPLHRAWERARDGRPDAVLDSGYRFARQDEAIYLCTTPHRIGPVLLHEDLGCYCAPADLGADALGRRLGGPCVVDHVHATRADASGACRHAHCIEPAPRGLLNP
jgi:hypothetical protein